MTETADDRLMNGISKWIADLENYPGWREWNRRKIGKTFRFGEPDFGWPEPELEDFVLSADVDAQHAVIYGYLGLAATVHSMMSLEFYFRRYPFRGLPVSKHEHLSNVCEMYFSRFYEFRERAKKLLNAANKTAPERKIDVGAFIRSFDKIYDSELRERHGVNHHARFSDIQIDKVWLTQLIAEGGQRFRGWESEHRSTYRAASREWAERVKRRGAALVKTKEAIAGAILDCCPFLVSGVLGVVRPSP